MKLARIALGKHGIIALPLFVFLFVTSSTNFLLKSTNRRRTADLPSTSLLPSVVSVASPPMLAAGNESCQPEQPCLYSDKVDMRIIVTTYNRPTSLLKLLESLDALEMDGHSAALEIWIDRNRKRGTVDERTVKAASEFRWSHGPTRVHVHTRHVGIYGQWIDTWRPRDDSNDELALIVEDDLSVSKYAYRWVRAVFRAYSHREDFAGASLTSHQMTTLSPWPKRHVAGPRNHTVVMYKCFATWGFAPKPLHWRNFQNWYHTHKPSVMPGFHPYVPRALPTRWYRFFEARGRSRSMWSMWFIYYMHINQLYSVYSNLLAYTGLKASSLVVNRQESGLHYQGRRRVDIGRLLAEWKDEYAVCPVDITRLHWDGSYIPSYRRY